MSVHDDGVRFAQEYYSTLVDKPQEINMYYARESTLTATVCSFEDDNSSPEVFHGIEDISKKLENLFNNSKVWLLAVSSQTTLNGGLFIAVLGSVTPKDGITPRKFTHTFILSNHAADEPYFVVNNILHLINEEKRFQVADNATAAETVAESAPVVISEPKAAPVTTPAATPANTTTAAPVTPAVVPPVATPAPAPATATTTSTSTTTPAATPVVPVAATSTPAPAAPVTASTAPSVTSSNPAPTTTAPVVANGVSGGKGNKKQHHQQQQHHQPAATTTTATTPAPAAAPKPPSTWAQVSNLAPNTPVSTVPPPTTLTAPAPSPAPPKGAASTSNNNNNNNTSANAPAAVKGEEASLYVRNLPFEIPEEDVKAEFAGFGRMLPSTRINTAKGQGYAFIDYESADCVQRALTHCRATPIVLRGRVLTVEPHKTQTFQKNKPQQKNFVKYPKSQPSPNSNKNLNYSNNNNNNNNNNNANTKKNLNNNNNSAQHQ